MSKMKLVPVVLLAGIGLVFAAIAAFEVVKHYSAPGFADPEGFYRFVDETKGSSGCFAQTLYVEVGEDDVLLYIGWADDPVSMWEAIEIAVDERDPSRLANSTFLANQFSNYARVTKRRTFWLREMLQPVCD